LSVARDQQTLATMKKPARTSRLRIRLYFEDGSMIGPGKADLLALIGETGSIAAAGRRMGMSYKRAWGLVDVLNSMFDQPLVESSRGGAKRGGATLTASGERVLALYRDLEDKSRRASAREIEALEAMLGESRLETTTARRKI
jgi:molybdate transport system regulatory protein